mmetsp:Transcript_14890/g.46347  ORF Transcript_14890/g.46347 Transcript_14890/m.46347 type:complete len:232 (+) Transcript_14890:1015-1710(+)
MAALTSRFSALVVGRRPPLASRQRRIACMSTMAKGTCACVASSRLPRSKPCAYSSSAGHGADRRRSSTSESGLASTTQCSPLEARSEPSRPYERAASSATPRERHAPSSFCSVRSVSCVATTSWKPPKKSGRFSSRSSTPSSTKFPSTASLSSCSVAHTAAARGAPTSDRDTRKLLPRSRASTFPASTTVKAPMPPSTRFLSVSVPVGPQLTRQTCASSSLACPCSPQMRS